MPRTQSDPRLRTAALAGLLVLQAAALVVIVLLTWPVVFVWHKLDTTLYFQYSLNLLSGKLPYRDFALEYPPLALLPFSLPRLAVFGQALGYDDYVRLFLLESVILSTLVGVALAWTLRCWKPRAVAPALAIYALLVAITAPLLPWRYDIFPALLTALALLCVLRGRPGWAGVWLGLGAAAKLYPLVLLPVFGAYYLANGGRSAAPAGLAPATPSRGWRALARMSAGALAAGVLTLLPFALSAPASMLSFLRYHELRGLQIETLPAGAIILAHTLGMVSASLKFSYGALHLISPLSAVTLRWLPLALFGVFGLVLASALLRFREERRSHGAVSNESLVAYVVAALLAFIVTNKVFSPQYVIWLLPFAPLLRPSKAAVFALVCALTIALFPFDYDNLLAMRLVPVLLLNLRNLLVVVLLAWLLAERAPLAVRRVPRALTAVICYFRNTQRSIP